MSTDTLKLIVGLGNPGPQYRFNRHNVGVWFLDEICRRYHGELRPEARFHGNVARVTIEGHDVRLLFPTTFMNRSGLSVASLCHYFDIEPQQMLVAYDEIDFPVGTTRLKSGGGHGGHNGMRDIISALGGANDFKRLRIGVGHPGDKNKVANYVLSDPGKDDTIQIEHDIDQALKVLPQLVNGQWNQAMQTLHSQSPVADSQ
ncbi:aminoacyl-tRNA hydrolase [Pseudohongiella sp. SYSU M77423]|uniref:aminoacyl-tRNA hydrolase n=1 Tax=Pseudohongiella sp. SYSU M77423 TaxID=3042312 RepID=UPI000C65DDD8|nr:aminoacyl-tRNA hydrolase [Pseudohongiella sp. SYSU M77423]MAY57185.1 aminoacyl-tRNA hydrolase [Gammaproteobacteria bacterium]MEC8859819.1 aminoacyl-tRNA hydrolase [Pseudomonadota bacterium]HBN16263.1 aminoacyl-tRNA hydrolase [Pseudohongiella sp.]MBJ53908.1 aminoacyl-tRNA hydrolase [Gammaproteobacteria bacterium]MDH7942428.1 aminoacyl-tRNA hydrolase [Pseudohongiella sp. SYSU M77423]|tara:strand:+ start:1222 stop:1827 length:606 start_codon:yes stop_codon:yes gene_type:complete